MSRLLLPVAFLAGCEIGGVAKDPGEARPVRQWVLVERSFDEVEPWIRAAGDAEIAPGESVLVFEPVEIEGEERFGFLLEGARCPHRLRLSGIVPDRRQVGEPVEIELAIDCEPWDLHRVEIVATRPGIRILGFRGALGELPGLSGFYVRGRSKVALRFTADSGGPGGIKAILFDIGRDGAPR